MSQYNYIQTFYADKEAVANAAEIMLTSLDLFFKSKPYSESNVSGALKPQVTVWLCAVENGVPLPEKRIKDSTVSVEWDTVACSSNATASTTFAFRNPVVVKTGAYYGIVIKLHDSGFILWENVRGDYIVKDTGISQTISPGSQSTTDGFLFKAATTGVDDLKLADRDLKYSIKAARYTSNTASIYMVNKNYEFFTIDTLSGGFIPGEVVYKQTSNATGNVTISSTNNYILGVGTTFQNLYEEQIIILDNGSANGEFLVKSITSNTEMFVDRIPNFSGNGNYKAPVAGRVSKFSAADKFLYLVDSNASNSTFKFAAGDSLVGSRSGATANLSSLDRFKFDAFVPKILLNGSADGTIALSYKIATEANTLISSYKQFTMNDINRPDQVSYILSRSQEVEGSSLYGTAKKSSVAKIDISVQSNNSFSAPVIDCDELDFIIKRNSINNTYTENRTYYSAANTSYSYTISDYDTEIDKNGLADTKYISKKIPFSEGIYAEDIKVFITAYRPSGTQIKVYAKLHNSADSDGFDQKAWTPLTLDQNSNKYSIDGNENDLIEYSYKLPNYSDILQNLGETHLAEYGNNIIKTSSTLVANLQENDVVRIYKPGFADTNHEVFVVLSSTATEVTLNKTVRNTNIVNGLGQPAVSVGIDKLKYKNIAFNNIANDNVARYYTSSKTEFDTFNTMQIKIVLLSDSTNKIPKVDQLQAIGVSA